MKTKRDLERVIVAAGGTLEEDDGLRDMRCFQAVAPDGLIWEEGVVCIRIDWAKGEHAQAVAFNESEFKSLCERLSFGLRGMTADEKWAAGVD